MRVLGIDVSPELLADWCRWFAPDVQPFFAADDDLDGRDLGWREITPETRDTFEMYALDQASPIRWLNEPMFWAMSKPTRARLVRAQVQCGRGAVPTVKAWADLLDPRSLREQADGHRFVWWPSMLTNSVEAVLARSISEGRQVSRHNEVQERTWELCATVLPGARAIAGTFPQGSGPNCFGTVMAVCGERGAADAWMQREPFETWLRAETRPGGADDAIGTVFLWRDRDGQAQHAAISIGDGWCIEKQSQAWSSPRAVHAVRGLVMANRSKGLRLERRTANIRRDQGMSQ